MEAHVLRQLLLRSLEGDNRNNCLSARAFFVSVGVCVREDKGTLGYHGHLAVRNMTGLGIWEWLCSLGLAKMGCRNDMSGIQQCRASLNCNYLRYCAFY